MLTAFRQINSFICLVVILFSLGACQSGRGDVVRDGLGKRAKVLFIGIDGVRGDALREAVARGMAPHLAGLIKEGTYCFNAATSDKTFSGPGWSDMMLGVHRDLHGVNTNGVDKNHRPYPIFKDSEQDQYLTIFEHLEKINPKLTAGHFQTWDALALTLPRGGRGLKDVYFNYHQHGDELNTRVAVAYLSQHSPDFTFFYIADVDTTGHAGHFAEKDIAYLQAIQRADANIGRVLRAIKSNKHYAKQNWLYIITSDHGGQGKGHSGNLQVQRAVPFIVSGADAVKQALWYGNKNIDMLPTALAHLGASADYLNQFHGHVVGDKKVERGLIANGQNLIFNGAAEFDHGFTEQSYDQHVTGWGDVAGQQGVTILQYGKVKGFPEMRLIGPSTSGANFFSSGVRTKDVRLSQERDLSAVADEIARGDVGYTISASLGSLHHTRSNTARFTVYFLDQKNRALGHIALTHKAAAVTINNDFKKAGILPRGTRRLRFELRFQGTRAYADNLSFSLNRLKAK